MSYCRVCGDESNVTYHARSGQFLCRCCAEDTPTKVTREEFDRAYWASYPDGELSPCESVRREFYEDYQWSTHTLDSYIRETKVAA